MMKTKTIKFAALSLALGAACAHAQPAVDVTQKPAPPPVVTWKFTLDKAAKETSAGVYDEKNRMVRVLWTLKPMSAGEQSASWDGQDNDGHDMPAGKYTYKIAASNATYKNVAAIGNSGNNTQTHVPINFESVAVDKAGSAYTVHDWDEPHFDVIKWDGQTGKSLLNTGHVVGGLVKAVAVEPDGSYAYITYYDDLNPASLKMSIARIHIKPDGSAIEPFTKAGTVIPVYAGKPVTFPAGASDADKGLMRVPLLSLAVHGTGLYATDDLGGRVLVYDKTSGELRKEIPVTLPLSVAVAPDGMVWVAHEHSKVSVFDADGNPVATPVTDATDINSITLGNGKLYIADSGASNVKVYSLAGTTATLEHTYGAPARPGDRAAHRFSRLHGIAVDAQGNIIVANDGNGFSDGRLAKFSPDFKPLWQNLGIEFQSVANYSANNPDIAFSGMLHAYSLDRKTGSWKFLGSTYNGEGYRTTAGPMRVVHLGANDFVFMNNGDGVIVYRVAPPADNYRGPTLKLASIVAGSNPKPNGEASNESWKPENFYLWTWHDEQGDNKIQDGEQNIFLKPGAPGGSLWQHGPITADWKGNLWFTGADWSSGRTAGEIWVIPMMGLDKQGNPMYDWKFAHHATTKDQNQMKGWDFRPGLVSSGTDGSIYAGGGTQRKGAPQEGGLWMGSNVIMRFETKKSAKIYDPNVTISPDVSVALPDSPTVADLKWAIVTPRVTIGLDAIPGGNGGVITGGNPWRGGISHYSKDGLLLGEFQSDEQKFGGVKGDGNNPSGLLDMYGAVSVNRDPRDGILDVFVEDDYNLRIFWYRVDDRDITTLSGTVEIPQQ